MYSKNCPVCSNEIFYNTKYTLNRSITNNSPCRSCTCTIRNKYHKYTVGQKNPQWKSSNEIPYSWFSKYFERSNRRKRTGSITIEDIYNLWIKQDKKCALSNLEIGFNDDGNGHTCSIDRIDSNLEYELNNVQLVHKDINMMKNKFNQEYFIGICKLIAGGVCEI